MVFSLWLWPTTKWTATKNTRQMLGILFVMQIQWCNAGRIAQWSASVTSCKATRCHKWASTCAILPRQLPWRTILNKTKNTNKTQLLPSFLTVDRRKKAKQFWDPKGPCTHVTNVKPYYLSWRAQLIFELSNVVNGQKFEKLLTLNKAPKILWAKYGLSQCYTIITQCKTPSSYIPYVPHREMLWWGQSLYMHQCRHTTYTRGQRRNNCSNFYLGSYLYLMHNLCSQTMRYPWGFSTGWQPWFHPNASWWHTCWVNGQGGSKTIPQIYNNKCKRKVSPICTIGKGILWNDEKCFTILPKVGCRSYVIGLHHQS